MDPSQLLLFFIVLRFIQHLAEFALSVLNYRHYANPQYQKDAVATLGMSQEDMDKTFRYSRDKFRFGQLSSWFSVAVTLLFIGLGGFGLIENLALNLGNQIGVETIGTGLLFFAIFGLASSLLSLPFEYYSTFVIEAKHGFNRQTVGGFFIDRLKGLLVAAVLGGLILSIVLYIIENAGNLWWLLAWFTLFGFSLLTAWIYPTLLAPLFNKFSPVEDGELKEQLFALAKKVEFQADAISIMDASTRSTHGNAYFTGVMGKKKIVLFDNLVKTLSPSEIVAVLAHELGHFKLNHVRWGLIRSFFITGLMFYVFSLCLPLATFYKAFDLQGVSAYGALIVFSTWLGPFSFIFQPIGSLLSRKNEFAADAFALENIKNQKDLSQALLKLREHSHSMPISHPLFSSFYHSHPPLLERLRAMNYIT